MLEQAKKLAIATIRSNVAEIEDSDGSPYVDRYICDRS
jgi:hypothetical protein